MARRMRVVALIETSNPDRPYWHQIGMAFESQKTPGNWMIRLNSLPLDGKCYLFPEKEREEEFSVAPGGPLPAPVCGIGAPTVDGTPNVDGAPPHTDEEIPF